MRKPMRSIRQILSSQELNKKIPPRIKLRRLIFFSAKFKAVSGKCRIGFAYDRFLQWNLISAVGDGVLDVPNAPSGA